MTEEPALCDLTTSAEYAKRKFSKRHRWFRRHRATLTTAFAVTAVAVFILGTYFDSQMENPRQEALLHSRQWKCITVPPTVWT